MADDTFSPALDRHRIPVIDRMMEVLGLLERRPNGASIRDLVESLDLPRTTVYRILNTLQQHDVVRRSAAGSYRLGPRLLSLAARAVGDGQDYDLAALALPHLERLSDETGEGAKLSVRDGEGVVVLAASQGKGGYALSVTPGQRLPIHAGAASKVLLAHLPAEDVEARLAGPLVGFTSRTITDRKRLRSELARIRRQGWAEDKGEYAPSICAFAAPVADQSGRIVAALSVPFLAGAEPANKERIRVSVIAAASAISSDLPKLR